MLYRGGNNANANAGVAYTNANNDASNANTNIGSRHDYSESFLLHRLRVAKAVNEGDEPRS